MKHPLIYIVIIAIPALILCSGLFAEETAGSVQADSLIDWEAGRFVLEAVYTPPDTHVPTPAMRQQAVNAITEILPSLFLDEAAALIVDSRHTLEDAMTGSSSLTRNLRDLSIRGKTVSASFSRDGNRFIQKIEYPLYPDLVESFIIHRSPAPQVPELLGIPSGQYSGIVIYVEEELPLYGTHRTASLQPAMFPKIYNSGMELIFEKTMADPTKIREWGLLEYFDAEHIDRIHSRVGEVPLFIHATALFGIHPTDLVVSIRSGRKLRASEHVLSLLRDGKIAIVIGS